MSETRPLMMVGPTQRKASPAVQLLLAAAVRASATVNRSDDGVGVNAILERWPCACWNVSKAIERTKRKGVKRGIDQG